MTSELRQWIQSELANGSAGLRLGSVLCFLGIPTSTWYRSSAFATGSRGRPRTPLVPAQVTAVQQLCERYPWWGYKRIAVLARRTLRLSLSDGCTYRIMRELGLLQRRVKTSAGYRQARYLFDLLPQGPNQVWQMDITYLALPQQGWYVVTVIDYYSRYLLGCYLTPFQNAAAVVHGLSLAIQEAERIHGSLLGSPTLVTDNGACFLSRKFRTYVQSRFHHVRIQYRTPQQLGLLERFHGTLKLEEIYWRYYDNPQEARTGLESFRYRYNYQRPH